MPHHKSATKRLRTSDRDRARNMAVKSALRKQLKAHREAETNAPEDRARMVSALDRAARKGVIPKARANRLKSRLSR